MDNIKIEYLPIKDLKPYERNAKKHDETQIKNVAESIKQFGFAQPIVVDRNNVVIIGHCRLLASKKLKLKEVPVVRMEDLTDEQVQKLRLLDNRLNESEWDFDLLAEDIPSLDFSDFDIDWGIPWDNEEEEGEQDVIEDEYDEDEVPHIAKAGEIYQLGKHHLMIASSTNKDDVQKLMGTERGRILFTSPPYSDMRDYNGGKDLSVDSIANFISCYRPYTDYQCVNLGMQIKNLEINQYWNEYIDVAHKAGYKLMAWNVWDKTMCGSIGQQKAFFPTRHEWIFVFGTDYYDLNLTKPKKESSIHESGTRAVRQKDGSMKRSTQGDTSHKFKKMESVSTICSETGTIRSKHPAVFPVALPSEYIQAMTNEGDIVIEPFGGSGTTLIACEQLNRKCRIMELDCHYADVIIDRWQKLTGEKAVRIDG